MNNRFDNPTNTSKVGTMSMTANGSSKNISSDLDWVDMLKGIAIIGVFLDNWTFYMRFATDPAWLYFIAKTLSLAVGPFVQVFFILSGFGLTTAYYKQGKINWSWKRWTWRRITKIVIPYEIVFIFSFVLGILGSRIYASVDVQFSQIHFFSYLAFLRNFHPQAWVWNPPFWFMPVIIGLYIIYPVLLKILTKFGPWILVLVSILVTYGTLAIAVLTGIYKGHGSDLFTFWVFQFALGMALAYIRETKPQKLHILIGYKAFFLGLGLVMCSWVLRTYIQSGKIFNDSVTSVGIFLLLLNLVWMSRAKVPITGKALIALSGQSYLMYLIHYPIMEFLIGPPISSPRSPIIVITLGFVYIVIIFILSRLLSRPLNKITNISFQYRG